MLPQHSTYNKLGEMHEREATEKSKKKVGNRSGFLVKKVIKAVDSGGKNIPEMRYIDSRKSFIARKSFIQLKLFHSDA